MIENEMRGHSNIFFLLNTFLLQTRCALCGAGTNWQSSELCAVGTGEGFIFLRVGK